MNMFVLNSSIRKCRKELASIRAAGDRLRAEDDDVQMQIGDLFDAVNLQMDNYIEGEYSFAVFSCYAKRKPLLVRVQTGETVRWQDVFPDSWENATSGQKHALVGLIEGGGEFRFRV